MYCRAPIPRKNDKEKVLVIMHDCTYGPTAVFNDAQLAVINKAVMKLDVDRVEYLPAVFCPHIKEPTKLMLTKCETRVLEYLKIIKPNVIVSLGKGPCGLFNLTGRMDKIKMGMFEINGLPKVNGENPKLVVTDGINKILEDYGLRDQLDMDLAKAVRMCTSHEVKPPENYYLIESPEEWDEKVDNFIKNAGTFIMAADIETNGKPQRNTDTRMRTISFSWSPGYAFCVPFELDPGGYLRGLRKLFASKVRFIWHNSAFDVAYLRSVYGLYSNNNFADTMLDAYLLRPGKGKYGYGLKGLALQLTDLGAYDTEINEDEGEEGEVEVIINEDGEEELVTHPPKSHWETIPLETLATYNCGDAKQHWCL